MKTKQIIKALRADGDPTRYLSTEAANRLEMLSVEQKKLHAKLAAMKEERDAALADIQRCCATCASCSHNNGTGEMCPYAFDCNQVDGDHWEWRGAKEANIPSKPVARIEVHEKYYIVTKNDWPYGYQRIADRYGVNVEDLLRVNDLTWDKPLIPGLKLWIPKV